MLKTKLLKYTIVLIFPYVLFSQKVSDSLANKSYNDLILSYSKAQKKKVKTIYADAFIKKAKLENSPILLAKGYYMYSLLYTGEKAIQYLDSVIKYSKNTEDLYFPIAAYCEKAVHLRKQYKFKEALENYKIAENYAKKKKNNDNIYLVKYYLSTFKSESLGETKEALKIYKECLAYYSKKDTKSQAYSDSYQRILFNIADAFSSLKQLDSATYYNKKGYKEAVLTNNKFLKPLFILNEGSVQIKRKNYTIGMDSIYKALPLLKETENIDNILAAYYYRGKAYQGMGKKELAVSNFKKVDSLYFVSSEIYPEFISGYQYLIEYYKEKGDTNKQLYYLNAFIKIDSVLNKNYKGMYKLLKEEYDIPNLFEEKENVIKKLETKNKVSTWLIISILILLVLFVLFGIYQYNLKKNYKKRFEEIINESKKQRENRYWNNDNEIKELIEKEDFIKETTLDVPLNDALQQELIRKLIKFEKDKTFLDSQITSQQLAISFETNTKYLGKVIKEYSGKNFKQYINDLRIDYAIITLQENVQLRKYTINALSGEFGFNNSESFSSAFLKKTALKPSYFIKELNISK